MCIYSQQPPPRFTVQNRRHNHDNMQYYLINKIGQCEVLANFCHCRRRHDIEFPRTNKVWHCAAKGLNRSEKPPMALQTFKNGWLSVACKLELMETTDCRHLAEHCSWSITLTAPAAAAAAADPLTAGAMPGRIQTNTGRHWGAADNTQTREIWANAHETRENLIAVPVRKLSVYLQPFRRSSFLECALQPKTAKINKKNPYFGSLRSFKVINRDTTKSSSLTISSMPMPICNRFDEKLANNGKITTFTRVPLFDALVRRFPWT